MTRQEALDKAAECLQHVETSVGDTYMTKYLNLAQMYIQIANVSNE